MSENTKEPLSIFGSVAGGFDGIGIQCHPAQPHHLIPLYAVAFTEEDANRIVACVNACAGIPNDVLESGTRLQALSHVVKQRDELLAAAEGAIQWTGRRGSVDDLNANQDLCGECDSIRVTGLKLLASAIASVKGKA